MNTSPTAVQLEAVARIPGEATAGATTTWPVAALTTAESDYDRVEITAVEWIPDEAVTANGTDYSTLTLVNLGSDGTGTTVLATRSFAAGDADALVADAFSLAGAADPQHGDVLAVRKTPAGSGVAIPAGLVRIVAAPYRTPGR